MKKNPNPERLTQSALCGPVGAQGTSQFLLIRLIWLFGAFSNSGEYGTNPLLRWIPGVFITPGTYHFLKVVNVNFQLFTSILLLKTDIFQIPLVKIDGFLETHANIATVYYKEQIIFTSSQIFVENKKWSK